MATLNIAHINRSFAEIFANGRGEAGLEVGADPGLPVSEHIRIPASMKKRWAAKFEPGAWAKAVAAAGDSRLPAVQAGYLGTPASMVGQPGWITSGRITIHESKAWGYAYEGGSLYEIDEFHIEPHSVDDVRNFITVNEDHIRPDEFTAATRMWIHATRFWAVAAGFVTTSTSKEWIEVGNPVTQAAGVDDIVQFISEFHANAWTASTARATSWRKSNHATGGSVVQGFPQRWLSKMGYIEHTPDKNAMAQHMRNLTSAFYVATHASSVHAVLALTAGEDEAHWADIAPDYGLILKWDIGLSAKQRMIPKTQVAGTAIVTDAMVVLRMVVRENLAPLLNFASQVDSLAAAYDTVSTHGIQCASYAKWFLNGHPEDLSPMEFSQKDATYADLAGELAIIGTKYFKGTSISGSMALKNAASQLGQADVVAAWSALSSQKKKLSGAQIVAAVTAIKGGTGAAAVTSILSKDEDTIRAGVAAYNAETARIGSAIHMKDVPIVNADRVVESRSAKLPEATGADLESDVGSDVEGGQQ